MTRTIFVTGTDTGVGKTVFATSLVYTLRERKINALGMKPFCSGDRDDILAFQSVQPGALTAQDVNPFYFHTAVAPLVVLREAGRDVTLKEALAKIKRVQERCDVLVVEGSGGLMVPLGEGYTVADLIKELDCELVVVSQNKLGTINHTLLTVEAAKRLKPKKLNVVMMPWHSRDASAATNFEILHELLDPVPLLPYPYFGKRRPRERVFREHAKILQKGLAPFLE